MAEPVPPVSLESVKRAVINIEVPFVTNPIDHRALWRQLAAGEITQEEYFKRSDESRPYDVRQRGTALFLKHDGRRYLITARHLIHDNWEAARDLADAERTDNEAAIALAQNAAQRIGASPDDPRVQSLVADAHLNGFLASAKESAPDRLGDWLFYVRSLLDMERDELGPPAYILSSLWLATTLSADISHDLAVISLDWETKASLFADELERLGYAALQSDSLAAGPSQEGAEIFTVGFPGMVSEVGSLPQTDKSPASHWTSSAVSLPATTLGRVAMSYPPRLPYFWCDITAAPGNSGGPVVEGSKVVGILTSAAEHALEWERQPIDEFRTIIPFARATRGEHVSALVNIQKAKDYVHIARREKA